MAFFAIAVYFVFALIACYPVVFHLGRSLPQPCDDPLLNCWILSWDLSHFFNGWDGYWNGPVFHPSTLTLAYSENLLGILPLALLIHPFTDNIILVHNLLILLTWPLTGICMYLFCMRLFGDRKAAFLAGLFFAFAPYRTAHCFHLNLLSMQWIPLILLFWHHALYQRKWWSFPLLTVTMVILCLTCVHYGLFMLFAIPALTLVCWLKNRDSARGAAGVAIACAAAVLALLPFSGVYGLVKKTLGIINLPSPLYSASIMSYVTPCQSLNLWGWAHGIIGKGEGDETSLFPGLLILLASVSAAVNLLTGLGLPSRSGERRFSAAHSISGWIAICLLILILAISLTGGFCVQVAGMKISAHSAAIPTTILLFFAVIYVITTGGIRAKAAALFNALPPQYLILFTLLAIGLLFSFYGPFLLLGKVVPPFHTMRVPARFFVLALFSLSILAGLGASSFIEEKLAKGWKTAAYSLASCIVLAECLAMPQNFIYLTPPVSGLAPAVYERLNADESSKVIAEIPFMQSSVTPRYMMYSAYHGKSLVNGYSGIIPRYMDDLAAVLDGLPSRNSLMALRFFNVDSLIVHRKFMSTPEGDRISAALSGEKALKLEGDYDGSMLYRVCRDELPAVEDERSSSLPISREGWKVEAPSRGFSESVSSALDGKAETYWTTGLNGRKGDTLTVDMGRPETISALRLSLGTDFRTYPRAWVMEVSESGADWKQVKKEDESFPPFPSYFRDPANPCFYIAFQPQSCRYLRLTLTKDSPFPFGAHEIDIY
jgi:hypothetical protein